MSRRPEICRDFQRGNCRFGARCKFLHDTSQQHQPSNPFGFGVKTQPQQGNYYGPLSGLTSPQRQQQAHSQSLIKEHRCSDPRVCKQQIKEDFQNEHPVFWRLTSYAHSKYFPNDIIGDVSFEELRAHSYDAGKQGLPFENVVQNERTMFNSKNMEFQNLLNNPYTGPASTNPGFQSSGIFSPVPLAAEDVPKTLFGKAALDSFSSPSTLSSHQPSSLPESFNSRGSFGGGFGKEASGFSFGLGVSSSPANATPPDTQLSAPFASLASSSSGFSFGTQPLRPAAPPFGMQSLSPQSPFASAPESFSSFGQSSSQTFKDLGNIGGASSNIFGGNNLSQAAKENTMRVTMPSSPFTIQNAPSSKETMSIEHAVSEAPSRDKGLEFGLKGQPGQAVQVDIWVKELWALGEIPEDEPPLSAR